MKEIPLTQGKTAIVDDNDYAMLSQFKWCAMKTRNKWYALRSIRTPNGKQSPVLMHRQIKNAIKGEQVDHKDGDGLNNTRDNLRLCNYRQNQQNSIPRKDTASKYKGVNFNNRLRKWEVRIAVEGKVKYLGVFTDEIDAGKAYNNAAFRYFGEFARPNAITA